MAGPMFLPGCSDAESGEVVRANHCCGGVFERGRIERAGHEPYTITAERRASIRDCVLIGPRNRAVAGMETRRSRRYAAHNQVRRQSSVQAHGQLLAVE